VAKRHEPLEALASSARIESRQPPDRWHSDEQGEQERSAKVHSPTVLMSWQRRKPLSVAVGAPRAS
jgi:hypothetical protein